MTTKIDVIDNSRGSLDFILNNKIQDNSNVFQFNNTAARFKMKVDYLYSDPSTTTINVGNNDLSRNEDMFIQSINDNIQIVTEPDKNIGLWGNVIVNNNIINYGDASFNNQVDISSLQVVNNAFFINDVSISNKLDISSLQVNNNSIFLNDATFTEKLDASNLETNNLIVLEDTSLNSLDSSGATSLASASGSVNIATSGALTTINGNLIVKEDVSLNNNLIVLGDTSINSLETSGTTSLANSSGSVNIATSGALTTIYGNLIVNEDVSLNNNLIVSGQANINSLDSSGATSLASASGSVNIASSGNLTTIKSKLNVDEAVTLDDNLTVSGNTEVYSLQSTDATSLATGGGLVSIATKGNSTNIKGNLIVEQDVLFENMLNVENTLNLSKSSGIGLDVSSNVNIDGSINILGTTTISGNFIINNLPNQQKNQNLKVLKIDNNNNILQGDVSLGDITPIITSTINSFFNSDFSFGSNVTISNDLIVNNDASFQHNVTISNELIVNKTYINKLVFT